MNKSAALLPTLLALVITSCTREPASAGTQADVIVVKVDGMQRGEGGRT
ncbi:MAG: hypothetical protein HY716_08725 [Planctomycetes bacterium]|nr:hypothetical protein [Planctomycetota bacterium]